MDFQDKPYVIGIDLGTTNCAVSYIDLAQIAQDSSGDVSTEAKKQYLKVFNIPQLTGHGEFTKIPVLPSFLYIPGEYDISKEVLKHPWKKREDLFAGSFARDHGSKLPSRLVSSAKSWLCNPNADRRAKILPWGSEGFEKVSPVTATKEYLEHIKNAWNYFVKDEDKFLENQFVVITVPASFDEAARELTMEAVKEAKFGNSVTLLEEPLAAFYSWLLENEKSWHETVKPDDLILVCDVGGGTTDFSLISLKEAAGSPRFERIAVGDHLILGGDNIDLALAKKLESKFKSPSQLSVDKWKTLCHRCREAKEQILDGKTGSVRVTIKGEGRSLIAGTLAADLEKEDVTSILRQQFFVDVNKEDISQLKGEKEITEFGLPFEKERSITRHIIGFLENHRQTVEKQLSKPPVPDWILFNGGTMKARIVQDWTISAIKRWFGVENDTSVVKMLDSTSLDLAVGIGASYYGMVKQGVGVKVGSGSPRNYYLSVASEGSDKPKAVCLVERGLDEGSQIDLSHMEYEVLTNEPVSFDIYSSSYRSGDMAGDIMNIDDTMSFMSPLQTVIRFGKSGEKKTIPVRVGAEYTEMGTLSMHCRSSVSDHKWQLSFQLRDDSALQGVAESDYEVYDTGVIDEALSLLEKSFSSPESDEQLLNSIAKNLEKCVRQKKNNWPLSFLRSLADWLIENVDSRKATPVSEAKWLNLIGFCIRPGFGDAFDKERLPKLWKVYLEGLIYDKQPQNRNEWWIFTRRIAGGLNAGQQRQFYQDTAGMLLKPKNAKVKMAPQETIELWMAVANMERLLVKDKVSLAKGLIPQLKPGKKQDRLFWVLSRLGARELLYGSDDRVVPPKEAFKWVRTLVRTKWTKADPVDAMMAAICRKTGDRTRDILKEDQDMITSWMEDRKSDGSYLKTVLEKSDAGVKEQNAQFGERLPAGLILKK